MKFVLYEVWTTARVIEADNMEEAYDKHAPAPREGLDLCNWHVVPVDGEVLQAVTEARQELRLHLAEEPQRQQ